MIAFVFKGENGTFEDRRGLLKAEAVLSFVEEVLVLVPLEFAHIRVHEMSWAPPREPLSRRERACPELVEGGRGEGDRRSKERLLQRRANPDEDRVDVAAHVLVRKPENPNAIGLENCRSPGVVVGEPVMLLAVDLHDELRGMAIEVDDVAIEGNLPAKLGAVETGASQIAPKDLLSLGRLLAETPGECDTLRNSPSPDGRGAGVRGLPSIVFAHVPPPARFACSRSLSTVTRSETPPLPTGEGQG
jgi:hypothetical protein